MSSAAEPSAALPRPRGTASRAISRRPGASGWPREFTIPTRKCPAATSVEETAQPPAVSAPAETPPGTSIVSCDGSKNRSKSNPPTLVAAGSMSNITGTVTTPPALGRNVLADPELRIDPAAHVRHRDVRIVRHERLAQPQPFLHDQERIGRRQHARPVGIAHDPRIGPGVGRKPAGQPQRRLHGQERIRRTVNPAAVRVAQVGRLVHRHIPDRRDRPAVERDVLQPDRLRRAVGRVVRHRRRQPHDLDVRPRQRRRAGGRDLGHARRAGVERSTLQSAGRPAANVAAVMFSSAGSYTTSTASDVTPAALSMRIGRPAAASGTFTGCPAPRAMSGMLTTRSADEATVNGAREVVARGAVGVAVQGAPVQVAERGGAALQGDRVRPRRQDAARLDERDRSAGLSSTTSDPATAWPAPSSRTTSAGPSVPPAPSYRFTAVVARLP